MYISVKYYSFNQRILIQYIFPYYAIAYIEIAPKRVSNNGYM